MIEIFDKKASQDIIKTIDNLSLYIKVNNIKPQISDDNFIVDSDTLKLVIGDNEYMKLGNDEIIFYNDVEFNHNVTINSSLNIIKDITCNNILCDSLSSKKLYSNSVISDSITVNELSIKGKIDGNKIKFVNNADIDINGSVDSIRLGYYDNTVFPHENYSIEFSDDQFIRITENNLQVKFSNSDNIYDIGLVDVSTREINIPDFGVTRIDSNRGTINNLSCTRITAGNIEVSNDFIVNNITALTLQVVEDIMSDNANINRINTGLIEVENMTANNITSHIIDVTNTVTTNELISNNCSIDNIIVSNLQVKDTLIADIATIDTISGSQFRIDQLFINNLEINDQLNTVFAQQINDINESFSFPKYIINRDNNFDLEITDNLSQALIGFDEDNKYYELDVKDDNEITDFNFILFVPVESNKTYYINFFVRSKINEKLLSVSVKNETLTNFVNVSIITHTDRLTRVFIEFNSLDTIMQIYFGAVGIYTQSSDIYEISNVIIFYENEAIIISNNTMINGDLELLYDFSATDIFVRDLGMNITEKIDQLVSSFENTSQFFTDTEYVNITNIVGFNNKVDVLNDVNIINSNLIFSVDGNNFSIIELQDKLDIFNLYIKDENDPITNKLNIVINDNIFIADDNVTFSSNINLIENKNIDINGNIILKSDGDITFTNQDKSFKTIYEDFKMVLDKITVGTLPVSGGEFMDINNGKLIIKENIIDIDEDLYINSTISISDNVTINSERIFFRNNDNSLINFNDFYNEINDSFSDIVYDNQNVTYTISESIVVSNTNINILTDFTAKNVSFLDTITCTGDIFFGPDQRSLISFYNSVSDINQKFVYDGDTNILVIDNTITVDRNQNIVNISANLIVDPNNAVTVSNINTEELTVGDISFIDFYNNLRDTITENTAGDLVLNDILVIGDNLVTTTVVSVDQLTVSNNAVVNNDLFIDNNNFMDLYTEIESLLDNVENTTPLTIQIKDADILIVDNLITIDAVVTNNLTVTNDCTIENDITINGVSVASVYDIINKFVSTENELEYDNKLIIDRINNTVTVNDKIYIDNLIVDGDITSSVNIFIKSGNNGEFLSFNDIYNKYTELFGRIDELFNAVNLDSSAMMLETYNIDDGIVTRFTVTDNITVDNIILKNNASLNYLSLIPQINLSDPVLNHLIFKIGINKDDNNVQVKTYNRYKDTNIENYCYLISTNGQTRTAVDDLDDGYIKSFNKIKWLGPAISPSTNPQTFNLDPSKDYPSIIIPDIKLKEYARQNNGFSISYYIKVKGYINSGMVHFGAPISLLLDNNKGGYKSAFKISPRISSERINFYNYTNLPDETINIFPLFYDDFEYSNISTAPNKFVFNGGGNSTISEEYRIPLNDGIGANDPEKPFNTNDPVSYDEEYGNDVFLITYIFRFNNYDFSYLSELSDQQLPQDIGKKYFNQEKVVDYPSVQVYQRNISQKVGNITNKKNSQNNTADNKRLISSYKSTYLPLDMGTFFGGNSMMVIGSIPNDFNGPRNQFNGMTKDLWENKIIDTSINTLNLRSDISEVMVFDKPLDYNELESLGDYSPFRISQL